MVEFEVKTAQGQSTVWKRYMVQLETVPVTYKCLAAIGGAVEADTFLAVVDYTKKHCHPDTWATALTQPKSATAHWLKKLDVEPVDIFTPRFCRDDHVGVVARGLRRSGE